MLKKISLVFLLSSFYSCNSKTTSEEYFSFKEIIFFIPMKITFYNQKAKKFFPLIRKEMKRLEKIFSLYKKESQIRILNEKGFLNNPPIELIKILEIACQLSVASDGIFDISIASILDYPHSKKNNEKTRASINYKLINFSQEKVSFSNKKVRITLNGLVQGFFADHFYHFLKSLGIKNALINTGEFKALGKNKEGKDWTIKIKDHKGIIRQDFSLPPSYSLAVSNKTKKSNIFSPKNPFPLPEEIIEKTCVVIGPSACLADGMATSALLLSKKGLKHFSSKSPQYKISFYD